LPYSKRGKRGKEGHRYVQRRVVTSFRGGGERENRTRNCFGASEKKKGKRTVAASSPSRLRPKEKRGGKRPIAFSILYHFGEKKKPRRLFARPAVVGHNRRGGQEGKNWSQSSSPEKRKGRGKERPAFGRREEKEGKEGKTRRFSWVTAPSLTFSSVLITHSRGKRKKGVKGRASPGNSPSKGGGKGGNHLLTSFRRKKKREREREEIKEKPQKKGEGGRIKRAAIFLLCHLLLVFPQNGKRGKKRGGRRSFPIPGDPVRKKEKEGGKRVLAASASGSSSLCLSSARGGGGEGKGAKIAVVRLTSKSNGRKEGEEEDQRPSFSFRCHP